MDCTSIWHLSILPTETRLETAGAGGTGLVKGAAKKNASCMPDQTVVLLEDLVE